jgi:DNA-binding transcriptional MerR regulator
MDRYRIKDLARVSGVSVRTLHHYDAIGLLVPKERSRAGYRLYKAEDLLRLQQILIHRELGFPLQRIGAILDDPNFDQRRALQEQRQLLAERAERALEMLRGVDSALAALNQQGKVQIMNASDIFNGFEPAKYEQESERRWGNTDAYKESQRRTRGYGPADWQRLKDEQHALYSEIASLMQSGSDATAPAACALAEKHRAFIERWFYPCTLQIHMGLADLYESDTRFADNIDKYAVGLTAFLSAAIRANAAGASRL